MVSTVNAKIIEMILSEKMKFNDFNFDPSTWKDGFIVELLRWFDNKINEISTIKLCNSKNINDFNNWKTYYEQFVRILYYFVVYKDIKDSKQLSKIFSYLFSIDDSYKNNYNTISSEKLMKVYNYLINHTPNLKEQSQDREYIDVLIGRWKTKEMENKLERIVITINNINNDEKISVNIVDDCDYSDNYSSDVCDYTDSDFYISSDSGDE